MSYNVLHDLEPPGSRACIAPVARPRSAKADAGPTAPRSTTTRERNGAMGLLDSIRRDIKAARDRDPAAISDLEVILTYPGFHARQLHRVAHTLHHAGVPVLPRASSRTSAASSPASRSTPARTIGEGLLHRPRHGRRHRRDGDHRRQLPPLPGRHARRHQHPPREAPPDAAATTSSSAPAPRSSATSPSARTRRSAPAPSSSPTCRRTRPSSACPATSSPSPTRATTPCCACPTPSGTASSELEARVDELEPASSSGRARETPAKPKPAAQLDAAQRQHGARRRPRQEQALTPVQHDDAARSRRFAPTRRRAADVRLRHHAVRPTRHLGHAMSYIIFDVLRRYLEFRGYKVKHVQNYTDIDDKLIARAERAGPAVRPRSPSATSRSSRREMRRAQHPAGARLPARHAGDPADHRDDRRG